VEDPSLRPRTPWPTSTIRSRAPQTASNETMNYYHNTDGDPLRSLSKWIRARAYQMYEARGRAPDHALDDWLMAEREVRHHLGMDLTRNGTGGQTSFECPAKEEEVR